MKQGSESGKPRRWVTVLVNTVLVAGMLAVGWKIAEELIQQKQSADFAENLWKQVSGGTVEWTAGEEEPPTAAERPAAEDNSLAAEWTAAEETANLDVKASLETTGLVSPEGEIPSGEKPVPATRAAENTAETEAAMLPGEMPVATARTAESPAGTETAELSGKTPTSTARKTVESTAEIETAALSGKTQTSAARMATEITEKMEVAEPFAKDPQQTGTDFSAENHVAAAEDETEELIHVEAGMWGEQPESATLQPKAGPALEQETVQLEENALAEGKIFAAASQKTKKEQSETPKPPAEKRPPQPTEDPNVPKLLDFKPLWAVSRDAKAWLYAPDTGLNQVVAQAKDNEYYLRRLLDGSYNSAGTLFIDSRNRGDFTDRNTIIYGHSMHNKSMFGRLIEYREADYCKEHTFLYLYIPGHRFRLDVVASFAVRDDSVFYTIPVYWSQWETMLEKAKEKTAWDFGVPCGENDHFVTFSTCAYEIHQERWILIARIDDPEQVLADHSAGQKQHSGKLSR